MNLTWLPRTTYFPVQNGSTRRSLTLASTLSATTSYFDGSPHHRQVPCYYLYIIGRASLQASQQVNSCSTLASIVTAHPYVGLLCVFTYPSHYRLQKPPKRKMIYYGTTAVAYPHCYCAYIRHSTCQCAVIGIGLVMLCFIQSSHSPSA